MNEDKITQEVIDKTVEDSKFISMWMDEMVTTMKGLDPTWDEKDIRDELENILKERLQIPLVELDNNFTGEHRNSNMISVMDWALEREPIIAGNGTFYKNQHEAINPIAKMLDGFLKKRKAIKKQMFAVEDKTSDLYKDLDRA